MEFRQLPTVELQDLLQAHAGVHKNRKLINIRGCNGAGKSTVPMRMLETDSDAYEVVGMLDGKQKTIATVFPQYETVAIGHYHSKCGGMDSVKDTDTVKASTRILWNLDFDILMEGILASTVRQTYIDLFSSLNKEMEFQREIIIYNILPPLQECLKRIQLRNGGKPIKEDLVKSKWETVRNNHKYFEEAGFNSMIVSNEGISRDETLDWYYTNLGAEKPDVKSSLIISSSKVEKPEGEPAERLDNDKKSEVKEEKKSKDQKIKELVMNLGEIEEMYLPTTKDLQGHDWAQYYKEPNESVVINWNNMRMYWYWIAERMNIWYKRTILKQGAPWTEDKILQEFGFTNAIRDLDKGTILYIRNILNKIDEPCDDLVKRKKEIIINTMIYRLFIRKETMDAIGWFLTLDNWERDWGHAKEELRRIRKSGEPVFHNAYYVNDLHAASPSPDNHDKTENAINMIENHWFPRLDEIYEFITTHNMKDTLDFLTTLTCVGYFTAYEFACDFALCSRHTENQLVDWTDDSYVNIGPGNKRGLDYIFAKKGNLNYYECNFYLRASWKHYMERYGYLSQFMSQLPDFMEGDINMRVIEHDLCELSKYLNAYYGIGRPKTKFGNKSKDNLDSLIL